MFEQSNRNSRIVVRRDGEAQGATRDQRSAGSGVDRATRFDPLETLIDDLVWRDRAEAAESNVQRTFLRPMGSRLALTIDSIDRFLADTVSGQPSNYNREFVNFLRHVSEELVDTLWEISE